MLFPQQPNRIVKASMALSWVAFAVYVFGLPYWSYLFTDKLGYFRYLCSTPADQVQCATGEDYSELARQLGREIDGKRIGCTCGEGIFGDWACLVAGDLYATKSFSISYYCATGPGTGGFAAVAFFPLLWMYLYGPVTNEVTRARVVNLNPKMQSQRRSDRAFALIFWTQIVFQLGYSVFQFASICAFPMLHYFAVGMFCSAEILHFLAYCHVVGTSSRGGMCIIALSVVGMIPFGLGYVLSMPEITLLDGTMVQRHGYWFGECCALACMLAITPLICILGLGEVIPRKMMVGQDVPVVALTY